MQNSRSPTRVAETFQMNRVCCCMLILSLASAAWADRLVDPASDSSTEQAASLKFELELTSVTLHAAGKGWFEYSGTVEGSGIFSVEVGTFEVDEAIRVSRVVDPAGAGEIRLAAGKDPVQPDTLVPNTRTLGDLLISMKGQSVVATVQGGANIEGTLVAIEQRSDRVGDIVEDREYMTILTSAGLRTTLVADAISIRATDDAFNERLDAELSGLATANVLPTSQIDFVFAEGEKRQITVGVMRRVPMWKISYRIENDKLIHRSIVDNTSGVDWSNVDLQLVDGNPVLFAMDMHSVARASLNRLDRPSKHVAVAPSFSESISRSGGDENRSRSHAAYVENDGDAAYSNESMDGDMLMGMAGMGMAGGYGSMGGGMGGGMGGMGGGMSAGPFGGARPLSRTQSNSEQAALDPTAAMNHVLAETQDAPAGSTLSLEFNNVDLSSGETALLDTVVAPIAIEDVSVYRQSYHPTATLLSLEIENNTPSLLPSGPLSVMAGKHQRAILGELVLPALGPRTKRLSGYAIDGGVRVTAKPTVTKSETKGITLDHELHKIKVEKLHQSTTDYEFLNRSGEERTVILEVPAPDAPFQWVHGDEKDIVYESADQFDRARFSLDDEQKKTQTITHQHTGTDVEDWGTIEISQLQEWIAAPNWEEQLKSELKKILESRRELDETNEMLAALLAARNQLVQEIDRVTGQLRKRYEGASLPTNLAESYATRLVELENQREKSENRMRELHGERRICMRKLGMNPRLPPELLPLRAFIFETDLTSSDETNFVKPNAEDALQSPSATSPSDGETIPEEDTFGGR